MKRMRKIGLTGGIGSGKTAAAGRFLACGAYVIDADRISRALLGRHGGCYDAVVETFGREILSQDGSIDRKRLAALVFSNDEKRIALNGIVHPAVLSAMEDDCEDVLLSHPQALVVCDVPLLFECGMQDRFDAVVLVTAEESLRIERVSARDGCTAEAAARRIRAQMPEAEKRALADYVLDNNADLPALYRQVDALYRRFTEQSL